MYKNRTLFVILLLFLGITTNVVGQLKPADPHNGLVNWMTIQEVEAKNKIQAKPVLIDIYTHWCGWCKKMMATTYSNPQIANYINTNFYPVKFNAETRDTIVFRDKEYINPGVGRRPTHQLAIELLGGKMSYPSTIFFHNNFNFKLLSAGYLDIKKIEPLLVFLVENTYRTTDYNAFEKLFKLAHSKPWHPDSALIKWHSFEEALLLQEKDPKQLLININTKWCNSCRVMERETYNHPIVADYINKHFYAVNFDAEQKDTIEFFGQKFYNANDGSQFHQFAQAALNGKIIIPSMIIFDNRPKMIGNVPYYMSPKGIEPVMKYYGDTIYKTTPWKDYYSEFKNTISE